MAMRPTMGPTAPFAFDAVILQLMSWIIVTLFSNEETFWHELISNTSEALHNIRHAATTGPEEIKRLPKFFTEGVPDKTYSTLTFEDAGITQRVCDWQGQAMDLAAKGKWCEA